MDKPHPGSGGGKRRTGGDELGGVPYCSARRSGPSTSWAFSSDEAIAGDLRGIASRSKLSCATAVSEQRPKKERTASVQCCVMRCCV